jgi:hypothetical protein
VDGSRGTLVQVVSQELVGETEEDYDKYTIALEPVADRTSRLPTSNLEVYRHISPFDNSAGNDEPLRKLIPVAKQITCVQSGMAVLTQNAYAYVT